MSKITPEEAALKRNFLKQRQSLPLHLKIELSKNRIKQFYEHFDGKVYVSFSGGKDSTVLLHLVRSLYSDIPAVFIDTGLEYPEIRNFVKSLDNTIILRPDLPFHKVIEEYGYPVISKEVAKFIEENRRNPNGYTAKKIHELHTCTIPSNKVKSPTSENSIANLIFATSDFDETLMVNYENRIYPIPVGYDNLLKTVYGNYMKLPPKAKQKLDKHLMMASYRKDYEK